jgi:hypothetical protein
MSWIEKINNDFIVTLGDGVEFRPLWLNAVKTKGFNITEFEFPNINGTLVSRTTSKGGRYNLELYFQGDDHLDIAAAFESSSEDPRSWTIIHPFYGTLIVQPSELTFDNTQYNVSKITGTVIETISDDNPRTTIRPQDNIALLKEQNNEELLQSFDVMPSPADASYLRSQLNKFYKTGKNLITQQEESQDYFNKFNTANAAIDKISSAPINAMRGVQAVINAPASVAANVQSKTGAISSQFNSLKNSVSGITTRASKKIYSANGAAILTTQALATVTPFDEIVLTRNEVFKIAEDLLKNYNDFIVTLDDLQTENNGSPESFIPDFESYLQLNQIVVSAISGLFELARNSRQERVLFLEDDIDIINLTHRLYGLDPLDANIDELNKLNSFGLNDLLELKKGQKVIYLV